MKTRFAACIALILALACPAWLRAFAAAPGIPVVTEDYPTTKVNFLYSDYSFWNTSGEARTINCMIIPVHFTDGYGFDDFFVSQVEKTMNGAEVYSARQYYLNASYGKIDLQYEIMPVYDVGISSWDMEAKWNSTGDYYWYGEHYWQIYDGTRAKYAGDLSKFDTDNDGYADMVIMVFDDPSVSGDDRCGTLYGGKVASMKYNRCSNNADHSYPSCNHFVCVEKYQMMPDDGKGESWRWEGDEAYKYMVLIHEIGHMFGICDLYNWNDIDEYDPHTPLGFDMHDTESGDLNPWTKISYGWLDPYVITPDIEEVTLRLRPSALYPDCILIPTSKGWNGTPFDEFMLVDVLAGVANNQYHWDDEMVSWPEARYDEAKDGGVRILHVDTRMAYPPYGKYTHDAKWFDPSRASGYDKKAITNRGALNVKWPTMVNSMGIGDATWYSPDPNNAFYFLLHSMTRTGEDPLFKNRLGGRGYYDFIASDLFIPGTSFSMETHASAFANAPYMNNYGTFDYRITVNAYDPETMEAIVTVKRISGTPAQSTAGSTVTVAGGTYVRQSPDASSPQAGYLAQDTQLEYTDIENGWYRVILPDGSTGYVYQSRIR
ncbi:MAG: SH3 domain-containing protein [Clostridia bacterium]|nr:SH3 domain-containing protein [Clostridia bacterium]